MAGIAASPGLWLHYLVVALAVLLRVAYVARHRFPAAVGGLAFGVGTVAFARPQTGLAQPMGRSIAAPPIVTGDAACGGCNGCDPVPGKS